MSAFVMRNIGLLLAVALVVFLVHKHMQTVPTGVVVGGAFSAPDDGTGMGNGLYAPMDIVAGNPNF